MIEGALGVIVVAFGVVCGRLVLIFNISGNIVRRLFV